MYKTFKFRLYPNNNQKILINKTFGCMRLVYNYYLNDIKENGYKNSYACIKDYTSKLKYGYPFLEVDSIIIRKTLFHLDDNLKKCYNNHFGYPKYKSKYFYQIDEYYPSSMTCSSCNNIDKKYKKLSERVYKCNACHSTIDRDLNASINILNEDLKLYMKEVYG